MPERGFIAAALALLAFTTAGCGYHFASEGSGLPATAKTIYVEKFTNRTRLTGINDELSRYIRDEIANHKRLELADSPKDADLVLSGEIRYFQSLPVVSNSVGEPIVYGQTLSATAMLTDTHTHQVIWRSNGISGEQQYATTPQSVVTTSPIFLRQNLRSQDIARLPNLQVAQTQRAFSTDQMLDELAQNLYVSMSEGF
ncbi:MAG TPA: LPS assembly lipoprotein LptE [Candidatus Binataceae bacterium]|nr:LPS assembly lipoprotein LptE [Candidatus Binataceae bacterium]